MFGSWQNDGTALWWLWCAVCLLFLVSPVVPGLMVSAPWLVPAVRCLHSPSSYPPLLSSSALPTSLSFFLIPSFILSAHVFLGEAKRSHSSHNPPSPHLTPLPFSLTPSFSSLVPFLHPTPLLLLFHSLFCHFLCPLLPSDCLSSLPFILPFLLLFLLLCFSLSSIPWHELASHDAHSHLCPDPAPLTHTNTHMHVHISQGG